MYIDVTTGSLYEYHSEIRAARPNTSFPEILEDENLASSGFFPVLVESRPDYDPLTQEATRLHPVFEGGLWVAKWSVSDLPAEVSELNIQRAKSEFVAMVDADVGDVYRAVVGNRGPEYEDAAREASAFIAASYSGQAPPSVASWAAAKGWTAQQAADDIMVAANALNSAKQAIRAQRLLRKEQARNAPNSQSLAAAKSAWLSFLSAVKSQLGV